MASGEVPARLMFLNDLAKCSPQEKVRFLCCIAQYRNAPGYFYSKHDYPRGSIQPTVIVDIEHALETTSSLDLTPGTWVNVLGYVTKTRSERAQARDIHGPDSGVRVYVQAIMIWCAGSVKLKDYEEALQARKDNDRS